MSVSTIARPFPVAISSQQCETAELICNLPAMHEYHTAAVCQASPELPDHRMSSRRELPTLDILQTHPRMSDTCTRYVVLITQIIIKET